MLNSTILSVNCNHHSGYPGQNPGFFAPTRQGIAWACDRITIHIRFIIQMNESYVYCDSVPCPCDSLPGWNEEPYIIMIIILIHCTYKFLTEHMHTWGYMYMCIPWFGFGPLPFFSATKPSMVFMLNQGFICPYDVIESIILILEDPVQSLHLICLSD